MAMDRVYLEYHGVDQFRLATILHGGDVPASRLGRKGL